MAATMRLIRMKGNHFATMPSRFGEAAGMPTPSIPRLGTRRTTGWTLDEVARPHTRGPPDRCEEGF